MRCTIGQISRNLYQLNEANENGAYVDSYLITGEKRAAVIDALETAEDLYDRVRSITSLPLDLLITHGHPDHAGEGMKRFYEEGVRIWMDQRDIGLYKTFFNKAFPEDFFHVLENGMTFDLGGTLLETIEVPGHTPGSVIFYDKENSRMFTGDAIGSGHFWMQIPGCLPLHEFRANLNALYELVKDDTSLKIYPGHRYQSPVQLNLQYIKDTLTLTDRIISGEENNPILTMQVMGTDIPYCETSYGMMLGYCYNPYNL